MTKLDIIVLQECGSLPVPPVMEELVNETAEMVGLAPQERLQQRAVDVPIEVVRLTHMDECNGGLSRLWRRGWSRVNECNSGLPSKVRMSLSLRKRPSRCEVSLA